MAVDSVLILAEYAENIKVGGGPGRAVTAVVMGALPSEVALVLGGDASALAWFYAGLRRVDAAAPPRWCEFAPGGDGVPIVIDLEQNRVDSIDAGGGSCKMRDIDPAATAFIRTCLVGYRKLERRLRDARPAGRNLDTTRGAGRAASTPRRLPSTSM